jgi:hypothetical protein
MKKKSWWKLLFFLLFIAVIPFAVQLALKIYLTGYLYDLENKLSESSQNTYRFQFKSASYNIFKSSLFISGFKAEGTDSLSGSSTFSTEEMAVDGIGLVAFLLHRKVVIDKIMVNGADISIRVNPSEKLPDKERKKFLSPYDALKDNLRSVFVSQIMIGRARVKYFNTVSDTIASLVSENTSLIFEDLLMDSTTTYIYNRWFDAKRFIIVSQDFKFTTADSLYHFQMAKLTLSYSDSIIQIDSVKMIPNFSEKQFAKRVGKQTDRITAEASKILMSHVMVKSIIEKRRFNIPLVTIDDCIVKAYRDKNIPRTEIKAPSVQNLIKRIPVYLKVDTVQFTNVYVRYNELVPQAQRSGEIFFSKMDGMLINITNDSLFQEKPFTAHASAKFMGTADIKGTFHFPYLKAHHFSFNGHLGKLDLKKLNVMLENNASVSVKDGEIKDVTFTIDADEKTSRGNMTFKYNNLQIEMLNRKTHEGSALKEVVATMVANKVILKNDNPEKDKAVRSATLYYTRNPNRFIFNDVWKTALTGITETLGIKKVADTVKKLTKKKNK